VPKYPISGVYPHYNSSIARRALVRKQFKPKERASIKIK
jgi:hypothetical protein